MANYAFTTSHKKKGTTLILCIFGGWFGLHQYYVGKIKKGLLYTFTIGLFSIGWIIDIFKILFGAFHDNAGRPLVGAILPKTERTEQNQVILPYSPEPEYIEPSPRDYDSMDRHQSDKNNERIMGLLKKSKMHIENISIKRLESKCQEWKIDTLFISTSRNCSICSEYNRKIYSLFGWNKKYPRLPEFLLEKKCPECSCCIRASMYFPGITTPPK